MTPPKIDVPHRAGVAGRLRNYVLTGLLVIGPSAVTLWVLFRLFNWVDNILGRYLRFAALDYHRIPGLGLLATLLLLIIFGWMAQWIGARSLLNLWDGMLTRIPGVGILYGSTKSLGEAFFSRKQRTFEQVVLVQWPHPGLWRIGFISGPANEQVRRMLGDDIQVVFVPHTPNPASGFVHYVPKSQLRYLDWAVEDGLKVVISGGVLQPEDEPAAHLAPAAAATEARIP